MSNDELDAGVLRILKERSDAKRARIILENDLRAAGKALIELGSPLAVASGSDSADTAASILFRHSNLLRGCPLEAMVREYMHLCHKVADLDERVKELGMD